MTKEQRLMIPTLAVALAAGTLAGATVPSSSTDRRARLGSTDRPAIESGVAAPARPAVQGNNQSQLRLYGFTASGTAAERARERQILGQPSAERMDAYHLALTAEPHHAGTPANERTAEYIAARLREFGFDEIVLHRYQVLLPQPLQRQVTLLGPERYELKLMEPSFPEDPDSGKQGVLPPFNAYAADGDVTAEVVYVNYGIPDDYEILDELGISVQGKIVIARYGHSWRGIKPRLAAERGALGCLLYSDPADDGYVQGEVVPEGRWRPQWGVQRGSVMDMPTYPGDPQTPGRPSKPGVERIPLDQVTTLQKIPVLPISYGDALPILRNLSGALVPPEWRGGLPITYKSGPGPARVHMRLQFDWSVRPIVDVIGILRGSEQPEKIIMAGGHRDAWTFGGRDPISGAVSLLESARLIGELARAGQRPRRSIAIASWDAEEWGLIGSVEYGEEFADRLQGNLVAYLNRESYTAGPFRASGVHSLQPFVNEIVRAVRMPDDQQSVWESWVDGAAEERLLDDDGDKQVRLGALGSGSDYTVFLDHLGIPAVDLGFTSGNGIYHSRYDSHWFFTKFGDPGFEHGQRLAEIAAFFLLRLANAEVLPFDYAATAETVDRYIDQLGEEAGKREIDLQDELQRLRAANRRLAGTAIALDAEIDRILRLPDDLPAADKDGVTRLNNLLLATELDFLDRKGLPGRPWFRHQLYAPGFFTGYGVKTLPGVREAIEK
ncbi:MAG: transferrin receptor-like dimerization domain-containing protein, partial [Acidobacteriota bacterium]